MDILSDGALGWDRHHQRDGIPLASKDQVVEDIWSRTSSVAPRGTGRDEPVDTGPYISDGGVVLDMFQASRVMWELIIGAAIRAFHWELDWLRSGEQKRVVIGSTMNVAEPGSWDFLLALVRGEVLGEGGNLAMLIHRIGVLGTLVFGGILLLNGLVFESGLVAKIAIGGLGGLGFPLMLVGRLLLDAKARPERK